MKNKKNKWPSLSWSLFLGFTHTHTHTQNYSFNSVIFNYKSISLKNYSKPPKKAAIIFCSLKPFFVFNKLLFSFSFFLTFVCNKNILLHVKFVSTQACFFFLLFHFFLLLKENFIFKKVCQLWGTKIVKWNKRKKSLSTPWSEK